MKALLKVAGVLFGTYVLCHELFVEDEDVDDLELKKMVAKNLKAGLKAAKEVRTRQD